MYIYIYIYIIYAHMRTDYVLCSAFMYNPFCALPCVGEARLPTAVTTTASARLELHLLSLDSLAHFWRDLAAPASICLGWGGEGSSGTSIYLFNRLSPDLSGSASMLQPT